MFRSKLLTADPKEHLRRAELLLRKNNNAFLLYAALELRLATERIQHNQYTMYENHSLKSKRQSDPVRKKLIQEQIDPESDSDYIIYFTEPQTGNRILWGEYKNIPENRVKKIEGRLGNLLHMKLGLKLGVADDLWYHETRSFLESTTDYLKERTEGSCYYFSFKDLDGFQFEKK